MNKSFLFILFLLPFSLAAQSDLYYTTSGNKIMKIDGLTNEKEELFGITSLSDITYDSDTETLYYTSSNEGKIYRYSLATELLDVVLSGLDSPKSILINDTEQKIYWTEGKKIYSSEMDGTSPTLYFESEFLIKEIDLVPSSNGMLILAGSNIEMLAAGSSSSSTIYSGLFLEADMAFDPSTERILFALNSNGALDPGLYYGNLSGDDPTKINTSVELITFIDFNEANGKIYFGSWVLKYLYGIDYDGGNEEALFGQGSIPGASKFVIDEGKNSIFYSQSQRSQLVWELSLASGASAQNIIIAPASRLFGIEMDTVSNNLYWVNDGSSTESSQSLLKYNQDEETVELVLDNGNISSVKFFEIDYENEKIYAATNGDVISYDLDGSNRQILVFSSENKPSIALDKVGGYLYYTQTEPTAAIYRIAVTGGSPEEMISLVDQDPFDLLINPTTEKIYWTDLTSKSIHSANLDGTNVETFFSDGTSSPYALEADFSKNLLYWSNISNETIERINFDGSGYEIYQENVENIKALTIGTFDFTSGLNNMAIDYDVAIFPNPTSDILNIRSNQATFKMKMISETGQLINIQEEFVSQVEWNISKLVSGHYYLEFELEDGSKWTRRIVKI